MKIRLYAQPPGRASMLIEVDLLGSDGPETVRLKCFSPPPHDQAEIARYGGAKAWAVTLDDSDVERLWRRSREVSVVPFGDAKPRGGGWPVELSFASGQAEARLNWWMRAPSEWTAVQALITDLMDLSERERSGHLDPGELDGDLDDEPDDGDARPSRALSGGAGTTQGGRGDSGRSSTERPKRGFFGRLLGG